VFYRSSDRKINEAGKYVVTEICLSLLTHTHTNTHTQACRILPETEELNQHGD